MSSRAESPVTDLYIKMRFSVCVPASGEKSQIYESEAVVPEVCERVLKGSLHLVEL